MLVRRCDKCGRDIPIITKEIFGQRISVYEMGQITLKEWNVDVSKVFVNLDLCVQCANEISAILDYELLKTKLKLKQE